MSIAQPSSGFPNRLRTVTALERTVNPESASGVKSHDRRKLQPCNHRMNPRSSSTSAWMESEVRLLRCLCSRGSQCSPRTGCRRVSRSWRCAGPWVCRTGGNGGRDRADRTERSDRPASSDDSGVMALPTLPAHTARARETRWPRAESEKRSSAQALAAQNLVHPGGVGR